MSEIEDVISRSRRGGGFAKRKTFTLARQRGIRKMREFALADPSYYILELIQSAVGNEASYINIEYDNENLLFSYVGGHLLREEMAHLFDFLFASKDKLEVAHLRELALGINALLLFEPERIVLESGDGTLGNTNRMVLRGVEDIIDIGRSDEPLNGTYLYATGLKRKQVEQRGMACAGERMAIESRCLTAPVLITVNNEAPFGYARMRIPKLWGYHPIVEFDEDDLYGVIGLSAWAGPTSFRLLTHGVWVQTIERDLIPGAPLGGIVNFDRLRKTADHSAIVHDDVFEEMWIRVRPYAQRLISKKPTPTLHDVSLLDGEKIPPGELRNWLRKMKRVVAIPAKVQSGTDKHERARDIAAAIHAPVVRVPKKEIASLRYIGGHDVDVVEPTLAGSGEVRFYHQPPAGPPAEPYLASPIEVPPESLPDLATRLVTRMAAAKSRVNVERVATDLCKMLGTVGRVAGMLYAPENPGSARTGVWAQVLACDRVVWEGELPSTYPGQWMVLRMPHVAPGRLLQDFPKDRTPRTQLARLIAETTLEQCRDQQAALHSSALRNLTRRSGPLGDAGRAIAMQALAQRTLVRLRTPVDGGAPEVSVAWLDEGFGMLDLHVFLTLAGTEITARELAANMSRTGGLVYGAIPEVTADLEGLNQSRILDLSQEGERMLASLLGDAAYVRVDRRDLLAEHRGVKCRDLAVGLRDYPDFPLLVEGVDPTGWSEGEQQSCVRALLNQLIKCYLGIEPPQPADPRMFPEWEENRRHAARHLQHFACTAATDNPLRDMVADLPLFLDEQGGVHTPRQVWAALARPNGLPIAYRGALASEELGRLSAAAAQGRDGFTEPPGSLAVSPYVARMLARLGRVRVAYDFDVTDDEAAEHSGTPDIAYIEQTQVRERSFAGRIGVPAAPVAMPAVVVLDASGKQVQALTEEAARHNVVGYVRLADGDWTVDRRDALATSIERSAERLMADLVFKLGELRRQDDAAQHRVEEILLAYAAKHLVLSANPMGAVVPWVSRPTAQAILDLPLFPTADGYAVSAWRLISEFCAFGTAAFDDPNRETALRQSLDGGLPDHLESWVRQNLNEGRVIRLASADARRTVTSESLPAAGGTAFATLQRTLTYWLNHLRPDSYTTEAADHVQVVIGHELFERESFEIAFGFTGSHVRWSRLNKLSRPDTGGSLRARGEFAIYDIDKAKLHLNRYHWLVDETIESKCEAEWVGWLLLASYAFINEILDPVTNEHEQLFQLRVAEALGTGELSAVD